LKTFSDVGLSNQLLRSISNMGFEEPTPIQEQAIPLGLEGRDIIGQAHTGTGKTAAFGIPLVERIRVDSEQIQGIVITPTRELAVQVAEELNKIGQFKGIRTLPIYGGQDIERQIRALRKRPHIIVDTNATVNTPAGEFKNCLKVKLTYPESTIYEYYQAGVGLVKREFLSEGFEVTSTLESWQPGDDSSASA
jgi:superfamily II DNA/RNA helicase